METRANYVAVGGFVLILLLGAAAMLLWLVSGKFSAHAAFYEIDFTGSVSGLSKDSPVRLHGIEVGHVKDIRIDPVNPKLVRVVVQTDPVTIVRSDAKASLEMQGLTGGAYIEIGGGTNDAPAIEHRSEPPYPVIASQSSGLQKVFDNAPEVLARLIEVGDRLNALLDEKNRAAVAEMLENMRQVSGDIRQVSEVLAKHSADIDATLTEASGSMKALHQTVNDGDDAVKAFHQTVKDADASAHAITQAAGQANALLEENRPALHDFAQRGLNGADQLLADLHDLVIKLDHVVDQLDRDPARYLFGTHSEGYKPK